MAGKNRTRVINMSISQNAFTSIFKRFVGEKSEFEFSGLGDLRQLLSNEKAKILYVIKHNKPSSVYNLAKILNRDFKSVLQDVRILKKFGFIELKPEKKGNRNMLKPLIAINSLQINFEI